MAPRCEVLKNGLRVILVPCEAESVAFGLFIGSGSRHETARTAGISHLIEHMLFKGTPTRRQIDITRAIEGRGGNFNACTSEEATCYFAHLPDECLDEAVDILSDMYLNAAIPEDEFAREKEVVIEEIKMYRDEPDSVAMENLQRALFPASRLGAPVAGSPESLRPLEPSDLKDYIAKHYLPTNTVAVVVGSFDPEDAVKVVSARLGSFTRSVKRISVDRHQDLNAVLKPIGPALRDVNQTQLAIGYRTFGIDDSRRYAMTVMDAVLGRGMSSRLFQEVREKRGLSYDISSRMQFFQDAGMFTVSGGTAANQADRALAVIDRELRRIAEKRVSAAELKRTKDFLVGNFRLSHEKVTSKLFFYGSAFLSFGRLANPADEVDGIRRVTADEVLSVAADVLRDENRVVSRVVPRQSAVGR